MRKLVMLSVLSFILAGCVTTFSGKAKVQGGPAGCEAKCAAWGMDLVGMVALGEYTDGCICKKKGEKLSMQDAGESIILSGTGAGAGADGVVMQMQRAAQQQSASGTYH